MQRIWWVVLLAGCGFKAGASNSAGGADAAMSAPPEIGAAPTCWTIKDDGNGVDWSACIAAPLPATTDIAATTSLDTDLGSSSPAGVTCSLIVVDMQIDGDPRSVDVCAIAADNIAVKRNVSLSAHGKRPLVLLAHAIQIDGTIDVASHRGDQRGAGSEADCNPGTRAIKGGGGAGGAFGKSGGKGGDQGGIPNIGSGGHEGGSISTSAFRGGCAGRRGGDGSGDGGPDGDGGFGGGAVWIASDGGTLKLGATAVINASGAGGVGATDDGHGGFGGGSGGLIVLQSTTITRNDKAQIFANGGHGGGGAGNGEPGTDGGDSIDPRSNGDGGQGGKAGDGGGGFPSTMLDGKLGDVPSEAGGGGGGGGAGFVAAVSGSLTATDVSPSATQWMAP